MTYYEEFINGHLVLPLNLLKNFKVLFRSADDFLIWLYFVNDREVAPSLIAEQIDKTLNEVNSSIQRMEKDGLLRLTLIEIGGQADMIFDVSPAFEKLDRLNASPEEKVSDENILQNLVKSFEAEMGVISPMQLEEIRNWLDVDKYSSDLIIVALKEASINKKLSLNYIRAILRNWRAEGIQTEKDVEEKKNQREISIQEKNASATPAHSFTIPVEGPWNQS